MFIMEVVDKDHEDLDFAIALSLQEELNHYGHECLEPSGQEKVDYAIALSLQGKEEKINNTRQPRAPNRDVCDILDEPQDRISIVDASLEFTDPHPDIHRLFCEFDAVFFDSALTGGGVAVSWSDRMKLCAGLCQYEGRGGLCSIRLSRPLLKFRSRKDLVETLLHEMIHAYLFVTASNKDRESHGPEFISHMVRINRQTGANITVYHNYHAEVDLYRQHWWQCNGPCQSRPPYYGKVKRSSNRAPSHNDLWWAEHQRACGGTFIKVKEPQSFSLKEEKRKPKHGDIKQLLEAGTSKRMDSSSTTVSFSGRGHVLDHQKRGGGGDTCDLTESQSIREKALAAAEQRLKTNQEKGKRKKPQTGEQLRRVVARKRCRQDDSHDIMSIWNRYSHERAESRSQKRTKMVLDNLDDCEEVAADLNSSDDGYITVPKQTAADEDCVIVVEDDVSSSSSSQHSSVPLQTCPVCLRTDIPKTVLSIHVNICLEEMKLTDNNVEVA